MSNIAYLYPKLPEDLRGARALEPVCDSVGAAPLEPEAAAVEPEATPVESGERSRGAWTYIQKATKLAETICHPRKIGGKSA